MPSPFAFDVPAYDREQVFRVSTYTIRGSSPWTGNDYDLTLDHDLVPDYFVLLQPTADTTGNAGPAAVACRVTQDPFGTGDLSASSGARVIRLRREGTSVAWMGTIQVVECLKPSHASGFVLETVKSTTLSAASGAGVQEVSTASGVAYTSRTVAFGGLFAGGVACSETGTDRWPSVVANIRFSAGGAILTRRWDDGSGTVQSATGTVYLVTFGANWTVQNVEVKGGPIGGADLNSTSEFKTEPITSVTRAQTWLWTTSITDSTRPDGLVLATLGDGVNELATETTVAAGVWTADTIEADCWVLSHSSLSVDWQRTASTSSIAPKSLTVPSPAQAEGIRASNPVGYLGRRLALVQFSAESGTAGAHTEALLYTETASETELYVRRSDNAASNVVFWSQVIDFGAIVAESENTGTLGPVQGVLLPDLELNAGSILSVSSGSAFRLGPVTPSVGNIGRMLAFHSGDPTADLTTTYRITTHGDVGDAGWIWQESGDTYWYGWNAYDFLHGTHPINGQTSARYGLAACYSSAYDRVVVGYLNTTTSTEFQLYYLGQEADPFSYVSLGTLELSNEFTSPVLGTAAQLRMIELDDGSLRLAVLVVDEDGTWDFDIYSSVDGGSSWVLIASRVVWIALASAISAQPASVAFAASGEWLRIVWVDATLADVYTLVSNAGRTWVYLGLNTPTIATASNGYAIDPYPIALVGRNDGAGGFILWTRDGTTSYVVNSYTSVGIEGWSQDPDMDFTLSSGREVEHLAAAYTPDGIFLVTQVDRSSSGEVSYRLRVYDLDDPQGNNSQVGGVSIYGPGIAVKPHQLHLLNGGRELLLAWNALSFAGSAIAGMGLGRLGGWSQLPVQSVNSDGSVNSQTWSSLWSDSPSSGTYMVWPLIQSGATIASDRDALNVQTSSAGQYAYWEFSPTTTGQWNASGAGRGMSCGGLLKVPQAAGEVVDRNIGIKVRAQGSGASGVSFMMTATTTQISVWDLVSSTKIGSIAAPTLATSWWEVRMGLLDNFTVFMAARAYEGDTWTERAEGWSRVTGTLSGSAGITLDLAYFGHQTYSGSGTNESEWREIWISDSYGNNLQRDGVTWDLLTGRTTTSRAQRVHSGVDVLWGGGGAARKDTFTGVVSSAYPSEAIFLDSPRYYWQAADDGAQQVVFDFGAGGETGRRSLHEGVFLLGTRARTATVEYANTNSWTSPARSYALDATIQSALRVLAVDGQSVLVEYPSLPESAGSLAGSFFRITAGTTSVPEGLTWKIRKHGAPFREAGTNRAWLYLESEVNTNSLGSYYIMAGDTACVFADKMAVLYGEPVKTRYMRVSFGAEDCAPNGKHALAGMVAGPFFQFDPPLDWTWKDNAQPNTTRFTAKSGVNWARKEGPAQRTYQGRMVGDQSQRARDAYRDLLQLFAEHDRRPIGLLVQTDGRTPPPVGLLYGRLTSGAQLDNEGWWRDTDGTWRPAGDLSVEVQEVV